MKRNLWIEMKSFLSLVKEDHKNVTWILFLGALCHAIVIFVELFLSSKIVNLVMLKEFRASIPYIAIMLITTLILGLIAKACDESMEVLAESCNNTIQQRLANKAFVMEYEEFEKQETMESIRRCQNSVMGLGGMEEQLLEFYNLVQCMFSILFSAIFTIRLFCQVGSQGSNFFTSYASTIVLLALYAFTYYIATYFVKRSFSEVIRQSEKNDHVNSIWSYLLGLFMDVSYGKETRIYEMQPMFDKIYKKYVGAACCVYVETSINMGINEGIIAVLSQMAVCISYVFIGAKAIYKVIPVGDVLLYVGALNRMSESISQFVRYYNSFMRRAVYIKTFDDFIKGSNMHYDGTLPIEKRADTRYEFEFCDVCFSYPGSKEQIIKHMTHKFTIGNKLAIVGRNGAGKSTLVKLLCRLYEPTSGKITLNGIDISLYDYEEYVKVFSVVFQDFKLFSLPIGENIAGGDETEEDKIWNCLEKVGLRDRVKVMPEGLKTQLYKDNGDGVEISGGEAQRLAIARALYKDAPFVILDEPTAALDPIAEAEIYENFNQMIDGKTALYISHRMSSCKFCDDILVMDNGCIAERGTHKELLKTGGIYANLYHTQAQYYSAN